MAVDFAIVGEVEGGDFVPLGNHLHTAPGPNGFDMLLKGIEIAYRWWIRNGREEHQLI